MWGKRPGSVIRTVAVENLSADDMQGSSMEITRPTIIQDIHADAETQRWTRFSTRRHEMLPVAFLGCHGPSAAVRGIPSTLHPAGSALCSFIAQNRVVSSAGCSPLSRSVVREFLWRRGAVLAYGVA